MRNVQPQSINLALYHPLLAPLQSQSTQIKPIGLIGQGAPFIASSLDKLCTCVIECEATDFEHPNHSLKPREKSLNLDPSFRIFQLWNTQRYKKTYKNVPVKIEATRSMKAVFVPLLLYITYMTGLKPDCQSRVSINRPILNDIERRGWSIYTLGHIIRFNPRLY